MSVRASLDRLERTAARALGSDASPCRCQGPMVVYYNEKAGTVTGDTGGRCTSCGREWTRINVRIVHTVLPRLAHPETVA